MNCKTCDLPTRVTRCYPALDAKVIERVCEAGHRHVYVTVHLHEAEKHGQGAYAVAAQIRSGSLKIEPT